MPVAQRSRQPVALLLTDGGKTLLVANRRSGSLSVIDATTRTVVGEYDVGHGLADLAMLPGRDICLQSIRRRMRSYCLIIETIRFELPIEPRSARTRFGLVVSADGTSCVVASLWSRRLTLLTLARRSPTNEEPALAVAGNLDLPLCPRELAIIANGSKLIVADAFGGRLAVVDTKRRSIDSVRSMPGHNIRGLAFAPDGRHAGGRSSGAQPPGSNDL